FPTRRSTVLEVQQATWFQSYPTGPDECTGSATLGADGWALTLSSGEVNVANDFGNYRKATVQGRKFDDRNADDSGSADPGQGGTVINAYADSNGDGILSAAEFAAGAAGSDTSVAVTGAYSISGLTPGSYIVCEVQQATWFQSYPTGSDECTGSATLVADGCALTLPPSFPTRRSSDLNYRKATVQGRKFDDRNAD